MDINVYKKYYPTIFQQILEEGVPLLQSNNNKINNELDSDDISEITILLNTKNNTWYPIIPHHGEWQFNQTEVQLKLQPEKQSTKTKDRSWTMSDNAKPFNHSVEYTTPNQITTQQKPKLTITKLSVQIVKINKDTSCLNHFFGNEEGRKSFRRVYNLTGV